MAIDIFNLQPSVITRDLSGKSFFIYGEPKSGKTSNAVKFPRPIIIGFEKGWNMLNGVYAQTIASWKDALYVKKQLLWDKEQVDKGVKEDTRFKTAIVDTVSLAYSQCEKFILNKEGVSFLDETENKRGYKAVKEEFESYFQDLVKAGYTVVAIAHAEIKQIKENGVKYDRIQPQLDKRGEAVLFGLCDVIGYAHSKMLEDGTTQMVLTMRGSKELEAGTRSKYMSEEIPFTYEALLADMQHAIDMEEQNGATVVDTPTEVYQDPTEKRDYKEVKKEVSELGVKIAKMTGNKEDVTSIVEKYLGRDTGESGQVRTVNACTAAQVDQLELILSDLKDKAEELGIEV